MACIPCKLTGNAVQDLAGNAAQQGSFGTFVNLAQTSVDAANGNFSAQVIVPSEMSDDQPSIVYVDYTNIGTVPYAAPLLVLSATQNSNEGAFLSLDPSLAGIAYNSNVVPSGFGESVQFLASGAERRHSPARREREHSGLLWRLAQRAVRHHAAHQLSVSGCWTPTAPRPSTGVHWRPTCSPAPSTPRPGVPSFPTSPPSSDRPGDNTSRSLTTIPSTLPASASPPRMRASCSPSRLKTPTPSSAPRLGEPSPPSTCPLPAWI